MRQTCLGIILLGTLSLTPGKTVTPAAAAGLPAALRGSAAAVPQLPLMFEPDASAGTFHAHGRGYGRNRWLEQKREGEQG